jgi:hypothetical protein
VCAESNNQHLCLMCFNKVHFGINHGRVNQWSITNAFFAVQYLRPMLKAAFVMSVRL